ncbi:RNA polymerase sigma factor [Saccharothrix coeruleofusca]|uniref:RNA polymerase sigma-70 factor (ECF subfamily) n=1 Tax=Saccharothrix coeruleofusca TaxID=33919 RepID=A0A918AH24_9PSEU|nr:sigma-70 family RNA polymerase sigma factor [Saccharothrix coeruleofusca]GGP36691.1 hypothetical protein GCM10010185_04810 [Saccharothrix coeruleofusca]
MSEPTTSHVGAKHAADTAFSDFYRATTRQLVAFLLLQGADLPLAADLAQETMTTLYRRWAEVSQPRAWAYRTASRALGRALFSSRETPTADPPLLRATADVEHWHQTQEVVAELARLPPRQRQVMAWTLFDHTPAEIAAELGMTPEAVRANLYQARKALIARREGDR